MNNAEKIFSSILKAKYKGIQNFISDGQEEHLFLDFKLKKDSQKSTLDKEDKKNYAKALSGFSNASGGVIVWGIDARKKQPDQPDIAVTEQPISNLKKFLTDLNSLLNTALVPINNQIQNEMIKITNEKDKGFIITYVPESDLIPHRALLGINQYYTRVGDSFVMMEHHMLEDSFGRRPKPKLNIDYKFEPKGLIIQLKNIGKNIARYPAIKIIDNNSNLKLSKMAAKSAEFSWGLRLLGTGSEPGWFFAGGANDIIHPMSSLDVVRLKYKNQTFGPDLLRILVPGQEIISIQYEIFAEGCMSIHGNLEILYDEIVTNIKRMYQQHKI